MTSLAHIKLTQYVNKISLENLNKDIKVRPISLWNRGKLQTICLI